MKKTARTAIQAAKADRKDPSGAIDGAGQTDVMTLRFPALSRLIVLLLICVGVPSKAVLAQSPPPLAQRTAQTDLPLDGPRADMLLPEVRLAIAVDPENRSISGEARYLVEARETLESLAFDLDPRFRISSIRIDQRTLENSEWANPDGLLGIALDTPLAEGTSTHVFIAWEGAPHIALNPPWEGGFVWERTPSGEPWIATAVQGEGCDLFWPCIDHSSSRIGVIDTLVTVPDGLIAAGNGALIETRDHGDGTITFHWRARDPSNYGVSLQIGPYQMASRDYHSRFGNIIPIRFWHLPESKDGAHRLVAEMATYLDFFEARIGPYPFADEKAGVAETPHLGMEHQTINAYGNRFRRDPLGYDWLLQHEFAHEWFANQLTNATISHMWLHEGIGQWMQPLYLEWARGRMLHDAEMWRIRQRLHNRVPLVSRDGTLPDYNDRDSGWGTDIYYKGAWVMHSLRFLVGDDVLFPALTRLTYGTNDPQPGENAPVLRTTDDFRAILEDMTGDDLAWFFDAYFYRAALPRLIAKREGRWLDLRWETPSDHDFAMPLELQTDGELRRIAMPDGSARVDLGDADTHFLIDPHNRILRYDEAIDGTD